MGPKMVKSTTELGERHKEVLKRASGGSKIHVFRTSLIRKMALEGSKKGQNGHFQLPLIEKTLAKNRVQPQKGEKGPK